MHVEFGIDAVLVRNSCANGDPHRVHVTSGMGEYHGYCVATDPTGDQFVVNFNDGVKQAWPAKTYDYSGTLTTGSGKYAGIGGTIKGECHAGDFRPVSAETYLDYCAPEGSYKLP
jgi:hypothetical protein